MSNKSISAIVVVSGLAFVFLLLMLCSFSTIPPGNVGIVTSFGQVDPSVLSEGFNWVAPWKGVTKVSIQTQEEKETASVPTREGLSVDLEVSLLYALEKDRAAEVFQTVGDKYEEVIVKPQFRSALRSATVKYEAKDLYTTHRSEIEHGLEITVRGMLQSRGVRCEKVLLRAINLPKMVSNAIESKLASEQEAQKMEFVIQKETKEAERKRVEAKGIADAQHIIQGTLTDAYLRYLWVEALKETARHNNATIYIPTGNDGMPFFVPIEKKEKK